MEDKKRESIRLIRVHSPHAVRKNEIEVANIIEQLPKSGEASHSLPIVFSNINKAKEFIDKLQPNSLKEKSYITQDTEGFKVDFCASYIKQINTIYKELHRQVFTLISQSIEQWCTACVVEDRVSESEFNKHIDMLARVEEKFLEVFPILHTGKNGYSLRTQALLLVKQVINHNISERKFRSEMDKLKESMKTLTTEYVYFDIEYLPDNTILNRIDANIHWGRRIILNDLNNSTIRESQFHSKMQVLQTVQEKLHQFPIQHHSFSASVPYNITKVEPRYAKFKEAVFENMNRDTSVTTRAAQIDKKKKKSIALKLSHILNIIFNHVQKIIVRKTNSPSIQAPNSLSALGVPSDKELAQQKIQEILVSLKNNLELNYSEKLKQLSQMLSTIISTESIFSTLETEKRFEVLQIYPQILQNLKKQCELEYQNLKLINKKDESLLPALEDFNCILKEVLEHKVHIDQRQTKVLHSYLKKKK